MLNILLFDIRNISLLLVIKVKVKMSTTTLDVMMPALRLLIGSCVVTRALIGCGRTCELPEVYDEEWGHGFIMSAPTFIIIYYSCLSPNTRYDLQPSHARY